MGENVDLVTLLHDGELHHILKHIFLPLSPDQLAVCRWIAENNSHLVNKWNIFQDSL